MPNTVSQLWWHASKIMGTLERWVEAHDNKRAILNYSKTDQLRLMTLRTWELRYRLPVPEILDIVVPIMRGVVKSKQSKRGTLGVSISTLTGTAAERILVEQIAKRYPHAEHIAVWRSTERAKQLVTESMQDMDDMPVRTPKLFTILNSKSPQEFVRTYAKRVLAKRVETRAESSSKERKRKAYRFNPWT